MRFKRIGDYGAKMLVYAGDHTRLYNTPALLESRKIFICEGEPDVWSAWMAGLPAVGIPGAEHWKPNAREFARVFANREVIVLAHNDDRHERVAPDGTVTVRRPGWELAQGIYKTLGGCKVVLMDEGHDVNSYAIAYGLEALREKAYGSR